MNLLKAPRPFAAILLLLCFLAPAPEANAIPVVHDIDFQPVGIHVKRLREAMEYLGEPLSKETSALLDQATEEIDQGKALKRVQDALDPLCLIDIQINPESRVKVQPGPAARRLEQGGWSLFLIKVRNEAGVTAPLKVACEQAAPVRNAKSSAIRDLWLDLDLFGARPLSKDLSGVGLEYRILQLASRDEGKRTAVFSFDVGQGTQDLGFRSDVTLVFGCESARSLTFRVRDENHKPTTASFVIRDAQDRIYPARSKRLAPDFGFHSQIYRADGETVLLPRGKFTVSCRRGPEYLEQSQEVEIGDGSNIVSFDLERWVDPAALGWWSGDHHIHAAGCSHYSSPTEGVHAPDMMRHCMGEDLKIGCNLTWGPCFDYQKQFFTGKDDPVSEHPYLLHYDVEVSGFGSHNSGHLCLLRLTQQIPEGGDSNKHWPTLCLNTLKWAKKQGAVVGPAHTGWGLLVEGKELPNYTVPPFDGIGANEYIVDVTHMVEGPGETTVPAVDFLSAVDTPYTWEMNIWYHTLNCGFRTRMSGETDFPCIYGERVGLGRAYVKIDGELNYNAWCEGVRQGRTYVSDGRSHILEFQVGGAEVGVEGSELKLAKPKTVKATATVAALLAEKLEEGIKARPFSSKPYWHLERARIDGTREVPVELIVNGISVAKKTIVADGKSQEVSFDVPLEKSSWVALRVEASSHTNPVFVLVDEKPIRASKRSAEWCLAGVERCWGQKERFIAEAEMADAIAAYDHAREAYRRIIAESN